MQRSFGDYAICLYKMTFFPPNLGKSNSSFKVQLKSPENCSPMLQKKLSCSFFCIHMALYLCLLYTSFHITVYTIGFSRKEKTTCVEIFININMYHWMQRSGASLPRQLWPSSTFMNHVSILVIQWYWMSMYLPVKINFRVFLPVPS